jgi:tRNA (adenine22-N1)-methyltransferase
VKISKRLKECAKFVSPYRFVADVGTDHALLPIYLIKENIADEVIASDVRPGPLSFAKKNIMGEGIKNIEVVLSDGIKHINDKTEVVIVSGLGGKLISEIISDDLKEVKRLILQPNMAADILRRKLQILGFCITSESIIKDNDIYYEILVADKGIMDLSSKEFMFGPINLKTKSDNFVGYWQEELVKLRKIISKIPKTHMNHTKVLEQITMIEVEL